ncbi:hypothetical protein J6590_070210 [Homalodisca vitripennis]|nr:hypothetical protein J6590_070210 [Homalodisca vitripennis]
MEDTTDVVKAAIFMEPPVNALQSDGDSDDEDPSGNINKLPGNQRRAGAELVSEKTENGIENFRYGDNSDTYDKDIVPGTPEKTPSRFSFLSQNNSLHNESFHKDIDIPVNLQKQADRGNEEDSTSKKSFDMTNRFSAKYKL